LGFIGWTTLIIGCRLSAIGERARSGPRPSTIFRLSTLISQLFLALDPRPSTLGQTVWPSTIDHRTNFSVANFVRVGAWPWAQMSGARGILIFAQGVLRSVTSNLLWPCDLHFAQCVGVPQLAYKTRWFCTARDRDCPRIAARAPIDRAQYSMN